MGDELAPICPRCRRRHLVGLPCWSGKYAARVTAVTLEQQGRVCWICGGTAATADHVVPRSRGGGDGQDNLRPACRTDNSRRGAKANPFAPDDPIRPAGVGLSARWRP